MIGFGYDSHKLASDGRLIIGGVEIESDYGVIAHSDGDVLAHALIDSLLGAAGMDDIGTHFPDSDNKYKNANSMKLLSSVIELIDSEYNIVNIDATIILEKPKLSDYKVKIKEKIASICHLSEQRVNIKAKSNEKMGFVGRSEGIVCYCICQLIAK